MNDQGFAQRKRLVILGTRHYTTLPLYIEDALKLAVDEYSPDVILEEWSETQTQKSGANLFADGKNILWENRQTVPDTPTNRTWKLKPITRAFASYGRASLSQLFITIPATTLHDSATAHRHSTRKGQQLSRQEIWGKSIGQECGHMSFEESTPGTTQRLNKLCLIQFPSQTSHQNGNALRSRAGQGRFAPLAR